MICFNFRPQQLRAAQRKACRPLWLALPSMDDPPPTEGSDTCLPPAEETPVLTVSADETPKTQGNTDTIQVSPNKALIEEMIVSSPTTPGVLAFDGAPASPMTPCAYRQSGISSIQQLLSTVKALTQLIKDNIKLQQ